MADENAVADEPTVIEVRKDVQTRQVKGGHVVLLFTRTYWSNGGQSTSQEDCVAATASDVLSIVSEFLGS